MAMDMSSSMSESLSIQDAWQKVFGAKGVMLVENFPAGLEFGCNCMVYETGSRFKGIAMFPSGLHFVYYSHINFPRQGFFTRFNSSSEPLKCRYWDNHNDDLFLLTNPDILGEKVHGILRGDFNDGLATYNDEQHTIWQNISHFITDVSLQRANCQLEKTLQAGDEADETEADRELTKLLQSNSKRPSNIVPSSSGKAPISTVETASYCPIQSIEADIVQATYQRSDFPTKLSAMELDKSWLIEAMLSRYYFPNNHSHSSPPWAAILGEMQIAFIMFMLLYSYHSLQHWKLLIGYIAKAESFLQQNQDFSSAFLKVLFHQLKFIPDDFFENEISANSFILPSLTSLFSCLNFPGMTDELQEHKKRFERYIAKRFNIRVVSTTISQYQQQDDSAGQGVKDSYCVIEGNTLHDNEELAAEMAGMATATSSDNHNNVDKEYTPVKLSIPLEQVLTSAEKEEIRYSWRYPLVYTAMLESHGMEDMIMTAMRVYDEISFQRVTDPSQVTPDKELLYAEAIKFIENEGPLM